MAFERQSAEALDYLPCRYGVSKLTFRGPKRDLTKDYVAVLGGTEVYGKYLKTPFVAQVEDRLGEVCVNLGLMNTGIDAFLHDPDVLGIAAQAKVAVVQLVGAHNMSNRFYRVHPRRNDRFLKASALLSAIYRDVDFTDFHFTKHMLQHLKMLSPERFRTIEDELQAAWLARMKLLLQGLGRDVVLLWLRGREEDTLGADPLFVTAEMVQALRGDVRDVVDIEIEEAGSCLKGMFYPPMEAHIAERMMPESEHVHVADVLAERIGPLITKQARLG
ncbi:DUF6473 family protein [Thalassococcus sp. S3]|uniref:DUF6473 family protein n=1 Tax=Thalassococcus sp. S3 TaxID=2017482 RepID=UPI0010244B0D|nr:DUF6473 family protein [Thalassococcus sp. S3]QBF30043.1 hypothetical protein CFI11_02240 [Thalassococcus sp. S3]